MTTREEVQAEVIKALADRPKTVEVIRKNRKHLEDQAQIVEPTEQDLEHETRELVRAALQEKPARREMLLANRKKNLERHAPVKFETPDNCCPFCGAEPHVIEVKNRVGTLAFRWPPQDCCEDALLNSAERALRYSMNPNNDDAQREEHAGLYTQFLAKLTRPAAVAWLNQLAAELLGRMDLIEPGYSRGKESS